MCDGSHREAGHVSRYRSRKTFALISAACLFVTQPAGTVLAQQQPLQQSMRDISIAADLRGRTVEGVRVVGQQKVLVATILNVVRTREGDAFDPQTVQEDYQRIFGLRRFSNVEAKVEPTNTGVIVVFEVTEQKQIEQVIIKKTASDIDEIQLRSVIDIEPGQAIDPFRIAQAKRSIQDYYKSKNYPLASVDVDINELNTTGILTLNVVEGPQVRVRNITFRGNVSFSADKLKDQIRSRTWIWIFREGTYSPDVVEDDVAALRKFYEDKGYFDARVGRRLVISPDQTEIQIEFLIDEGPRYTVTKVTFKGNASLSEAQLRQNLRIVEGLPYQADIIDRDVRKIVRDYSPLGYIYQPGSNDPDYLVIDTKPVFRLEPGTVELVYEIREGKPFRVGQILPRGNTRTQDKVVARELRLSPGDVYDSGKIQDATERLRGTPLFQQVKITPVGNQDGSRDLLIEVEEARTATLTFGAGINSNGGIAGNITYTQKNFDITNWPRSLGDITSDRALVGAGQTLRISVEPGTEQTNASIRFTDPWVFDQPYSFSAEFYVRNRQREDYDDNRYGGRFSLGRRFGDIWSGSVGLRVEHVDINDIDDKPIRAFEILEEEGGHPVTSITLAVRRDTTTGGILPAKGNNTAFSWESVGALGGDYTFQKFSASHDQYYTLYEDLTERKTIVSLHADAGYIAGTTPFFERFYAGGIGSVRGFAFRGISPRSGPDDDRIGGDFFLTGSAELSFPLVEELLRGVVFTDVGLVEPDFEFNTVRVSVGGGIRVSLPILGQVPVALDFAVPLVKDDLDDRQIFSFSLGFTP
jgi:outer membrane protein insertion porin family